MGLDTSWTDSHPVTALTKSGEKALTNIADNYRQVKISDNELTSHLSDNRLSALQTKENNSLSKFKVILNAGASVIDGLFSVINTAMQTYAQVTEIHEQTKRVQIQADAYVRGKKEETRQTQIHEEHETIRYLASLKKDLEVERMNLQRFEAELSDRVAEREFNQEKWRQKIKIFEKMINPLIEHTEELRKIYRQSDFSNENLRADLQNLDEKIYAYSLQINSIYA